MASLARVASLASLLLLARPIGAQQACPGEPHTLDLVRPKAAPPPYSLSLSLSVSERPRPTVPDGAHQDLVVARVAQLDMLVNTVSAQRAVQDGLNARVDAVCVRP